MNIRKIYKAVDNNFKLLNKKTIRQDIKYFRDEYKDIRDLVNVIVECIENEIIFYNEDVEHYNNCYIELENFKRELGL